jgi:hypothetical protein
MLLNGLLAPRAFFPGLSQQISLNVSKQSQTENIRVAAAFRRAEVRAKRAALQRWAAIEKIQPDDPETVQLGFQKKARLVPSFPCTLRPFPLKHAR